MDPMTANHTVRNPQAQIDMILQNSSRSPLARFIEFPNELYILSNPAHSEPVSISVFFDQTLRSKVLWCQMLSTVLLIGYWPCPKELQRKLGH